MIRREDEDLSVEDESRNDEGERKYVISRAREIAREKGIENKWAREEL